MSKLTPPDARRHRLVVVLATAALTLGLAACGSSGSGNDADRSAASPPQQSQPSTGKSSAANLVPADIKSKGKLTVAIDPTFPPSGFYASGKKLSGADVDMANALAGKLGLQPDVVATSFDSIIPGIQAGRYALGMSLINVTAEREKTLDFVAYFENGSSIMAPADTKLSDTATLEDLCGHSVAVQRAAVQAEFAKQQSTKCTSEGKSAVKVQVFPDYDQATLAIANGRVDAGLFDQTNAAYTASQKASKLKVVGKPFEQTPCGIASKKGDGLAQAVLAGLNELIEDGTYGKILDQWNLTDGAVSKAELNPAA
jgi:polar amino acid transport system substrate-binding protein